MARRLLVLVLLLTGAIGQYSAQAQQGMNLHEYCITHGYAGGVTNIDGTAYGWNCVDGNGNRSGMDMYAVCAWMYGGSYPEPRANYADPNSWQCYAVGSPQATPVPPQPQNPVPQQSQGGMDIGGYCGSRGYPSASPSGDAYTWACRGNGETGIDMNQVCAWQYNGALPHVGLRNRNDPNSWYCANTPQAIDPPNGGNPGNPVVPPNIQPNNPVVSSSCNWQPAVSANTHARVIPGNNIRFRNGYGLSAAIIGTIPSGSEFDVTGDSVCADNNRWWPIRYNGQNGWTAEGDSTPYWIQPFVQNQPVQQDAPYIASTGFQIDRGEGTGQPHLNYGLTVLYRQSGNLITITTARVDFQLTTASFAVECGAYARILVIDSAGRIVELGSGTRTYANSNSFQQERVEIYPNRDFLGQVEVTAVIVRSCGMVGADVLEDFIAGLEGSTGMNGLGDGFGTSITTSVSIP